MRTISYFYRALLLVLMFASYGVAQPAGGGAGFGRGRMLTELGLNAEQIKQFAFEEPGQGMKLRMGYENERKILNDLVRDRATSDQVIKEQLDKVNASFADWNRFRLERVLTARNILTPEQLDKLLKMQEERGGSFTRGPGRCAQTP